MNGFHNCLIGEKESHRLERSLNYYQIGFDGIVNGKLKSWEMIIKRERERENRKWKYLQLWCLVVPSVFMFNCLKWRSLVLNQIQALHSLNAKRYMLSRNWNPRAGLLKYSKGPNLNFNDSNHLLLLINFTSSYGLS